MKTKTEQAESLIQKEVSLNKSKKTSIRRKPKRNHSERRVRGSPDLKRRATNVAEPHLISKLVS